MSTDAERRDHLQTLERGISVIVAFSGRGPWLTLGEVAASTGLPKPTVRRILVTLEGLGYARFFSNRYALTPKVLGLGYAYLSSLRLTDVARPEMESLTDQLGLGTSLAALDGNDVIYLDRVQRHRVTSMSLAVGTRLPAHATSMGHVLLAGLRADDLETYLAETPLFSLTAATVVDTGELRARLELVRARGWDAVDQELEIGRRSAAAPITDATGQVSAAVSLSCGTAEHTQDRLLNDFVPPLRAAAARISESLGGNGNGYLRRPSRTQT